MLLLVCCSSCYGVLLFLLLLKGCLSKGDRHGRSGEKQVSDPEVDGPKTSRTGRGIGKGRFIHPKLPSNSLWIERKLFCASMLIPGRTVRVTEMLPDRRFSVDFKSNELPWLIGVLREASTAKSGSFSKQIFIGSRSMEVITMSNRAGVVLKLKCSFGGKNRRLLLIPAGKNNEGWDRLAKLLASVSNGGKSWVKKSFPPSKPPASSGSCQQRDRSALFNVSSDAAVRGKENPRGFHSLEDQSMAKTGWKEGFLPDMLKIGLRLSLGAPSSSGEANRRFVWKTSQSELGLGTLVVEQYSTDGSLENSDEKLERGRLDRSAGGVDAAPTGELVGVGVAEEVVSDLGKEEDVGDTFLSDEGEAASLGNLISKVQLTKLCSDAKTCFNSDPLAGGPSPCAGMDQQAFAAARDSLSFMEHSGSENEWAEEARPGQSSGGLVLGTDSSSYQSEVKGITDRLESKARVCRSRVGLSSGGSSQLSGSVSVGPRKETGPVSDCSWIAAGTGSLPVSWSSISEEVSKLSPYVRRVVSAGRTGDDSPLFLARYEDITIADNVEDFSLDSFFNECNGDNDGLGEEIGGVMDLEEIPYR